MKLRIFAVCTLLLGLTACATNRGKVTLPQTMPLLHLQEPNSSVEFIVHVDVPKEGDSYVLGIAVPIESKPPSSQANILSYDDLLRNNSAVRLEAHVYDLQSNIEQPLLAAINNVTENGEPPIDYQKRLVNPGLLQSYSWGPQIFEGRKTSLAFLVVARLSLTKSGDYRVQLVNRSSKVEYSTESLPFFELQHLGK